MADWNVRLDGDHQVRDLRTRTCEDESGLLVHDADCDVVWILFGVPGELVANSERRNGSNVIMRRECLAALVLGICLVVVALGRADHASVPTVQLQRVPDGGIQPQLIVDREGTIHLVYFKGDPAEGDLFYAKSEDGTHFSKPIQVNSVPGSAVALGNIRGARLAAGRSGQVFVVWNGSGKLGPPSKGRSPMLFTQLNRSRTAFEPERNLIHTAFGIDGGGGIAADQAGRVYVFWHAPIPGHNGEANRRVWVTRSDNDGKSFQPERVAWDEPVGACGCCSLDAHADPSGKIYVLFRSAQETIHRDMYLLESVDHGRTFHGVDISKWTLGYCAMSSEAFVSGPVGTFAAWETEKRIHFEAIGPNAKISDVTVSDQKQDQKYPALATNRNGYLLVAWTEGMKWKHGGSVDWQIFDQNGKTVVEGGHADGVPAWSLVAAFQKRNSDFVVLY